MDYFRKYDGKFTEENKIAKCIIKLSYDKIFEFNFEIGMTWKELFLKKPEEFNKFTDALIDIGEYNGGLSSDGVITWIAPGNFLGKISLNRNSS